MQSVNLPSNGESPVPSARVALELRILDGAREAQRQSAKASAQRADTAEGGALVLVVAGDDDVRSYLQQHLRDHGLRVAVAMTVQQAIECLDRESPRVIVVDAPESSLLTIAPHATSVVLADALPRRPVAGNSAERLTAEWVLLPWPFEVQTLVHEVARLAA